MPQSLENAVLRVLDQQGKTVGAAFLVGERLAVTCAHVVGFAGGGPGQEISACFLCDEAAGPVAALVLAESWSPADQEDVAFLQLAAAPAQAVPLPLAEARRSGGHGYLALGYPRSVITEFRTARDEIVGLERGKDGHAWLLHVKGDEIARGMSGGPLLDLDLDRVVGMVTKGQDDTFTRLAYATPAETLRRLYPALPLDDPDALLREQEPPAAPQVGGVPRLPPPVTTFTGRERELEWLCENLRSGAASISGLRGMGGIGKTQLALALAQRVANRCPDGQLLLDLRGPDPANALPPADVLAQVIHSFYPLAKLPEDVPALAGLVRQALHGKKVLLLLDNAASAAQALPLLPPPEGCLILVTARRRLALPGMDDIDLEALPEADAQALLVKIAPRIGDDAPAIARACACLPLALTSVASLMRVRENLPAADVLRRMKDATQRLKLTAVDASLHLSEACLSEDLRAKWRKLGVFAGDFSLWAVPWVWGTITDETTAEQDEQARDAALDDLGALLEYSLLAYEDGRYRLHDLARDYTLSRLAEPETRAARLAHARYYQRLLSCCNDLYLEGREKVLEGLALFDREKGEILAGQAWAAAGDEPERLALANDYAGYGNNIKDMRLHPRERMRWLEAGLRAARLLNDRSSEAVALGNLGLACAALGETRRAIAYHEQHLAIARETGDRRGEANALNNLGLACAALGETRRAIAYHEQALIIARETGDRRGEGQDLNNLGLAYASLGETRRAIEYHEQRLVIARETGDRRGEANALGNLGLACASLGETRRAIEYHEQALIIDRETGDRRGEGADLGNLGLAYSDLGETCRAIEYHEQQLEIARETGDRRGEASALGNLGIAYKNLGETRRAIEYYEQVLVIFRDTGDRRGEGAALNNLGLACAGLGETRRAIEYYEQSLVIKRETGDRRGEANTCWNLGLVYEEQGDLARAAELMQVLVDFERGLGHPDAEKDAARVEQIRARLRGGAGA